MVGDDDAANRCITYLKRKNYICNKGGKMKKALIAVTMGDPAGIGPEITAKALADEATFDYADCIVIGDKK